ncbi:MAG: hypothetical protein M3279_10695 [Actinomycetota bacterium]|nr:hypothetical protein [Actinomycetota bacterium]
MKKMLLLMASAAILAIPFAGPAAADAQFCEVGVIVHEQPSVDPNPTHPKVVIGEYQPYTDCHEDPPIWTDPICLQKPPVCVV